VERAVKRLVARQPRATGLLIGHAQTYLSVLSSLARLGLRTPDDISLISREDDPFLSALLPAPARYVADPRRYAQRIHRTLMAICAGQTRPAFAPPLLPELVPGGSVRTLASLPSS
jgi:DNA-binding LacI/PurR family transcriptional regulator